MGGTVATASAGADDMARMARRASVYLSCLVMISSLMPYTLLCMCVSVLFGHLIFFFCFVSPKMPVADMYRISVFAILITDYSLNGSTASY